MSTPFLGEIKLVSFGFAPKGWALCAGSLLPINQNQALFSLLGPTYGGDGRVNFALPDMRGRAPMHFGGGVTQGQKLGEATHTLTTAEMPAHVHGASAGTTTQQCSTGPGTSAVASGRFPAVTSRPLYADAGTGSLGGSPGSTAGSGTAHNNMQPYLALTFVIALQGIFPSQA